MVIASLLPLVNVVVMAGRFGVQVPFWDDWSHVMMLDKYISGTLTLGDLWNQHIEHRPVLMKLVRLLSVSLTDWNVFSEMAFSICVASITCLFLTYQIVQTHGSVEISSYGWLVVLSSALVFSPVQHENFLWGHQTGWFLQNLFTVVAIFNLTRRSRSRVSLGLAILFAVLSSFSQGGGLVLWPLGIAYLIIEAFVLRDDRTQGEHSPTRPSEGADRSLELYSQVVILWTKMRRSAKPWYRLALWSLFSVGIISSYVHGLKSFDYHLTFGDVLERPFDMAWFVCSYLGTPLAYRKEMPAVLTGAAGLFLVTVCTITCLYRAENRTTVFSAIAPWLLLALYVVGIAVMTGMARLGLNWEIFVVSRYTTISYLFWLAASVLTNLSIILWFTDHMSQQRLGLVNFRVIPYAALVFVLVLAAGWRGESQALKEGRNREIGRNALLYGNDDRELSKLWPHTRRIRQLSETLKRHKLSLFGHPPILAEHSLIHNSQTKLGGIDTWGGDLLNSSLPVTGYLEIKGWAECYGIPSSTRVFLVRGHEILAATPLAGTLREIRNPNSKKRSNPRAWRLSISGKRLGPGESKLNVYLLNRDGISFSKLGEKRLTVTHQ